MRLTLSANSQLSVLTVLVLWGSLVGAAVAQGMTTVSMKAGASFATWGGSDVEEEGVDNGYRRGLAFRASAVLPLTDLVALQIGAAYVEKGTFSQGQIDIFGAELDAETSVNMGYLDLPVLLRVSPKLSPILPYVTAGPAFSYSLNCSFSTSVNGTVTHLHTGEEETISESESAGCGEDVESKTLDFGVTVGAGVILLSPALSPTLEFLYDYGLVSIDKESDVRNRAFAIMAGVTIPIR